MIRLDKGWWAQLAGIWLKEYHPINSVAHKGAYHTSFYSRTPRVRVLTRLSPLLSLLSSLTSLTNLRNEEKISSPLGSNVNVPSAAQREDKLVSLFTSGFAFSFLRDRSLFLIVPQLHAAVSTSRISTL